ncbi:MAG TPA: Glu/Leu/Phe/Val dehydrogenase dimerization domain-containing protein [Mycobacteriales bacterium]|nr:Glu/Leu/Phe/Val dehydrogenase dimerization domain-containing protein [Mycobacteriales bacterium]
METFEHERVVVTRGERTGLTVIVAVHSTALGQAAGGCRMWRYDSWRDGLRDALRLSEAMTYKSALAGLPLGGGKSVIALPPAYELTGSERRDVMLDLGDVVESLHGTYGVAEDVGTTAEDMLVASERTRYAYCLPESAGGSGEPSAPTAVGVYEAILATCEHVFGEPTVDGRRCTVVGLGQVGGRLARRLAADGAELFVSDVDVPKRGLADELGATWLEPSAAYRHPTDVLVPAALGGVLTPATVASLQCRAIVGPANNQLATDDVAELLAARDIVWAPDFVVNAGGVLYGALVDVAGAPPDEALEQVRRIGQTLREVLTLAADRSQTPYAAAMSLARARIAAAKTPAQEVAAPTTAAPAAAR